MYKGFLHEDAVSGALVEWLANEAAARRNGVSPEPRVGKVPSSVGSMFSFRWLKFEVVIVVHPRGARSR